MNEAGLEFKPVKCNDDKWYGIQCKYFSSDMRSTSKYSQIYKSVSEAIERFKGQLDIIYIYTNGEFGHSCTEEEIESSTTTKRVELVRLARKENINIEWIQADKILDCVKQKENRDLYSLYFSNERNFEFLNNLITPKEKTFLESDEFVSLKFGNNIDLLKVRENLKNDKLTLILGDAGTGKSLALKKICNDMLTDYMEVYFSKTGEVKTDILFPVLIKLRECTNGNIEELIRGRLKDYEISKVNGEKQICYLFDGLDEIPTKYVTNIISYIQSIAADSSTKSVIISSRSESTNLVYLNQVLDWKTYKIDKLTKEQKIQFLRSKESLIEGEIIEKILESELLNEINDIFSLNLLYENIDEMDINGSKIELIEISMNSLFDRYQKLTNINILYPKVANVLSLCMEIAYRMQQKKQLYIELKEIESLIREVLFVADIETINSIVEMFLETCFEKSFSFNMTFKHRRIQEYFLYRKIEEEYYDNPNILRELNLLANKDFMCNIFLSTSLKRALNNNDLFKISALRLLESYLGEEYIKDFKSDIILGDNHSYIEANYKYSERLIKLLATYSEEELELLFSDDKFGLLEIFNKGTFDDNTFLKLVNSYWKINNVNIIELLKKYNLVPKKIRRDKELLYYHLNISDKNIELEKIYEDIKNNEKLFPQFLDIMINKDIAFIESIIEDLDAKRFDSLCKVIFSFENIKLLYYREKNQSLFDKVLDKTLALDNKCGVCAKILFSFIVNDERFYNDLEIEFEKYNKNHFWTWIDNLEVSIYMAIILKKTNNLYCSEFNFGAKLIEKLYENKKDNSTIFGEVKKLLIASNFTCKDSLNFVNTRLLGIILANIDFDVNQIKKFLRVVFNYESVINVNELMFRIYMINKERFYSLANQAMLSELEKKIGYSETSYYEEIIESIFSLGAMYSKFSLEKRHELLVKGIDTSICRPEYKGEKFISKNLLECVCKGYESFWFDKQKLENILVDIYSSVKIISNRTENRINMGYLKWVLVEYDVKNDVFEELYNIEPQIFDYNVSNIFKKEGLNLEANLEEYYEFKREEAPYASTKFWEYIIEYGDTNQKLNILIESLYQKIYDIKQIYIYIPISILLKYKNLKEEVSIIVANKMGREGIYNITKVIALDDSFANRKVYLNHLLKFMNFLTNNDFGEQKEGEWFEYKEKDWRVNEGEQEAYFIKNRNIKIIWNDNDQREEFHEEWATKHIDKRAYKYDYTLYIDNIKMKEFGLVWVDGFRALLPIPKKYGEYIVRRDEYLICRMLNSSVIEFNNYMKLSGLKVE